MYKISNTNSTHIMQTIIDHNSQNTLKVITTNLQYVYLCSILQDTANSDIEYFSKNKEKKLNMLLEINSTSSGEIWLTRLNL